MFGRAPRVNNFALMLRFSQKKNSGLASNGHVTEIFNSTVLCKFFMVSSHVIHNCILTISSIRNDAFNLRNIY